MGGGKALQVMPSNPALIKNSEVWGDPDTGALISPGVLKSTNTPDPLATGNTGGKGSASTYLTANNLGGGDLNTYSRSLLGY